MQTNKTYVVSEPAFVGEFSPRKDLPVETKKSVVAHLCQTPGALHFYASDVCIFCDEHRAPWIPGGAAPQS